MSACDELSFIAWWHSSSRDNISWSLHSNPKACAVQINEAFLKANASRKKCLNIGLSDLSVVNAKKTHVRSASKMVKSVHQWPNIICFVHWERQEFWDKFWSPTKWLCHQLLNKPDGRQQWSSNMGGETQENPGERENLGDSEKICSWKCNNKSEWRQYLAESGQMLGHGSDLHFLNKGQKANDVWEWWDSHSTRVSDSKQNTLNKSTSFEGLRKKGLKNWDARSEQF